jgi:hypothetical protein
MKCPVCLAINSGTAASSQGCSNCGHPLGRDLSQGELLAARAAFRDKTLTYAPETRVTAFDKSKPWLGLLLGILLFWVFLQMCASAGGF